MLTACKMAADDLEAAHRVFAEQTDLDLTGYSGASAIWLLAGLVIGLLRALPVRVGPESATRRW